MNTTDTPKIYVASLSDYNSGILHGAWIDATQDADDIQEAVNAMLAESPAAKQHGDIAEEWAIHDFDFGGIKLGESESFETVSTLANLLEKHGEAFAIFWNNGQCNDASEAGNAFEEAYLGVYDSGVAFVEQWLDDTGGLDKMPEDLRPYFDYEAYARDAFMTDVWGESGSDGFHVFRNY